MDLVGRPDDGGAVALPGQEAVDEFAGVLEGLDEAIEARPQVGLVECLQRAREEAARLAVVTRIDPRRTKARLAALVEIGACLMMGRVQPGQVGYRCLN